MIARTEGVPAFTITDLEKGGLYEFRARPIRYEDGRRVFGVYTGIVRRWLSAGSYSFRTAKDAITVNVKAPEDASSFKLWYSENPDMKDAKTQVFTGAGYTLENLNPGTTYYLRLRPYKKAEGKTYIGSLSSIRTKATRAK